MRKPELAATGTQLHELLPGDDLQLPTVALHEKHELLVPHGVSEAVSLISIEEGEGVDGPESAGHGD